MFSPLEVPLIYAVKQEHQCANGEVEAHWPDKL